MPTPSEPRYDSHQTWRTCMRLGPAFVTIAALVLSACSDSVQSPPADPATVVIKNGKIVTMESSKPVAQAIAFRGDVIAAVGSNDEVQPLVDSSTQVIDLQGQFAMPGIIEGHGHLMNLGQSKMSLDLMDVKNWDEVIEMVRGAAANAKPGDWILGRGWHQEKWDRKPVPDVEGFPVHDT
jgi:predicted amidohydrolase YtcJ